MFRSWSLVWAAALAATVSGCDKSPSAGPNTGVFGEPESVADQVSGGPAETICQKFEACGLLKYMGSSSSVAPQAGGGRQDDTRSGNFGVRQLAQMVDSQIGSRQIGSRQIGSRQIGSRTYAEFEGDNGLGGLSDLEAQTPMGICLLQVGRVFKGVDEQVSVRIDWGTLAYCIASSSCSNFTSEDGWQRLGEQCAGQLGIDISGGGGTQPPDDHNQPDPPDFPDAGPPSGDDACTQAANKLKDCVDGLNCSDFQGEDLTICEAFKSATIAAPEVCAGEEKQAADQINACNLDELCRCQL